MKKYSQNDDRWKNYPINKSMNTIGQVGCLLTSLTNIYNIVNPDKLMTPKELNELLIMYNGYTDGNLIIWSIAEHVLDLNIVHHYSGKIEYSTDDFFIVNYINFGYGHFTNLISKKGEKYNVYDVYDNVYKTKTDIRRVVKVSRK